MTDPKPSRNSNHSPLPIFMIVLGVVLVLLILWFAFGERVVVSATYGSEMKKLKNGEVDYVHLSDPLFDTGIPTGSGHEFRLTDPEACVRIRDQFLDIYDHSTYDSHTASESGMWCLFARFSYGGRVLTVYFDDTYFCFGKGDQVIRFRPADPDAYQKLKTTLENILRESYFREG